MPLRNLCLCFLGAALAASVLTTGCGHRHHDRQDDSQPAQTAAQPAQTAARPAPNETVIYNKWEVDTHRAHKEISQRTAEEQREYNEWRRSHPDGR